MSWLFRRSLIISEKFYQKKFYQKNDQVKKVNFGKKFFVTMLIRIHFQFSIDWYGRENDFFSPHYAQLIDIR